MDQIEKPPTPSESGEPLAPLPASSPVPTGQWERVKELFPKSALESIGFDVESWLGPSQNSKRERLKSLLLNGRLIVSLLTAGSLLLTLGAFSAVFTNFGSLLVAFAMCSVSFRQRLVARYAIVALLVLGAFLFLSSPLLGKPVYDAGLVALNTFTDPSERIIWGDPSHREVPGYEDMPDQVFVETGDGIQIVDTTTEAGKDLVMRGIKTDLGERFLQAIGLMLNGSAMALAGIGTTSRLLGVTRAPSSIADRSGLFDGLSRRTIAALAMLALGFATAIIGGVFGDLLNDIFDDRLYYLPGEGVNREAQGVAFSMLILYKAKYLGYMAWSLGIILLLIGTPRRKLFAWFDRRALNGGRPWDPVLKKTGVWLLAIGILGGIIQFHAVVGFFVGTGREILLITTGDWEVLLEEPRWLGTLVTILDLWAAGCWLGIVFLGAGSKTVRKTIGKIYGMAGRMGSTRSSSGSSSSTPSQSGNSGGNETGQVSGGAIQAGQAAEARRRGGRGR